MLLTRMWAMAVICAALAVGADRPSALEGQVIGPSGKPLDALIALRSVDAHGVRLELATDSKGRFRINSLPSGIYEVSVYSDGFFDTTLRPIIYQFPNTVHLAVRPMINVTTMQWDRYDCVTYLAGELRDDIGPVQGFDVCLSVKGSMSCDVTDELGQYYLEADPADGAHEARLLDEEDNVIATGTINLTGMDGATIPLFVWDKSAQWALFR